MSMFLNYRRIAVYTHAQMYFRTSSLSHFTEILIESPDDMFCLFVVEGVTLWFVIRGVYVWS